MPGLINSQTLKRISQVASFLWPDKQATPEESRRTQWPKRYITTNNSKDEDNSSKNHTQNQAFLSNTKAIIFKQIYLTHRLGTNKYYHIPENSRAALSIAISCHTPYTFSLGGCLTLLQRVELHIFSFNEPKLLTQYKPHEKWVKTLKKAWLVGSPRKYDWIGLSEKGVREHF